MSLIVAVTGLSGFFCSWWLLQTGMHSMLWRYPLALGLSWLVFLMLLRTWLHSRSSDFADVDATCSPDLGGCAGDVDPVGFGHGGEFGGAGASGGFDVPGSAGGGAGDGLLDCADGVVGDVIGAADEAAIPLIVLLVVFALVAGAAIAAWSIIAGAPMLFGELLLDGILSYSLYRRIHRAQSQHWLYTAIRRTWLPFAAAAACLTLAGALIVHFRPGADSIGDLRHPTFIPHAP